MFQVRIHGRGGHGVVTAAELLSLSAFLDGKQAQAFPSFGSERTGAPVAAFCRVDDQPIRLREPVVAPDGLIIGDATLLHQVDVFAGFLPAGYLLINSPRPAHELGLGDVTDALHPTRVVAVPATEIAMRLIGRPLPHAALLGAFAAMTDLVTWASLEAAIRQRFSGAVADANAAAALEAHHLVHDALEAHGAALS